MRTFTFCLLLTLGLWQCSNSSETTAQSSTETTTTVTETPAPAAAPAPTQPYPSISSEKMKYLWDNCDYVDFVMYGTNFSMSQSDQDAIRSTLAGISTTPAQVVAGCRPVGRIFFQVDGQNEVEADIFYGGNQCLYYLFLEDGTYVMGNQFTQQAVNFYQQIFSQVTSQ